MILMPAAIASASMSLGRARRRVAACLLIASLGPAVPALALDPSRQLSQYVRKSWDAADGLVQNTLQVVLQTRDGYIWLGTEAGLVRFDGARFTTFDRHNTPALQHHNIRALAEGHDGTLWIGTQPGGLVRYRDGHFSAFGRDQGLPDTPVYTLHVDRTGTLWVGTFGAGLARWAGTRFEVIDRARGLAHDHVRSIFEDHDGVMWVGTDGGGVSRIVRGRVAPGVAVPGLATTVVWTIAQDRRGAMWFGTYADGQVAFGSNEFQLTEVICGDFNSVRYYPDNFTGRIDPALQEFQSVNNDGGAAVNEPAVFRRIACYDDEAMQPKGDVKPPPFFPARKSSGGCGAAL